MQLSYTCLGRLHSLNFDELMLRMLRLYRRLVVQGLYRYTRNSMFWGAFSVVFGEALIFNSLHLLYYFLLVVAMQMVHVPLNEERWLRRGFGAEYDEYCRQAHRGLKYGPGGCLQKPTATSQGFISEGSLGASPAIQSTGGYGSESNAITFACLSCSDPSKCKAGLQTYFCARARTRARLAKYALVPALQLWCMLAIYKPF